MQISFKKGKQFFYLETNLNKSQVNWLFSVINIYSSVKGEIFSYAKNKVFIVVFGRKW